MEMRVFKGGIRVPKMGGKRIEFRFKGPFEFQTSKEIFHNFGETTFSKFFAPFPKRKGGGRLGLIYLSLGTTLIDPTSPRTETVLLYELLAKETLGRFSSI